MYSSACRPTNAKPRMKVSARKTFRMPRLPALSAWCAIVIVTPEVSRIAVLIAGSPNAGIVSKAPPTLAGPLVGQVDSKLGPQEQVRHEPRALAAEPRHRQLARVEQRAEERREEHHLGEDEPAHAHAERAVDPGVVEAALALVDDRAEPAEEHVGDGGEAEVGDPRAQARAVQHRGRAEHRDEQRGGTDGRPLAAVRDVVLAGAVRGVCLGHGAGLPLVLLQSPAAARPTPDLISPRACAPAAYTSNTRASSGPPAAAGPDRR